ncbi:hypothetical protein AB205_0029570 [Aquarana catesbeiana]|uniref:Uncharacterized protein n=1 Tax=Aquarana catesbeiana TaxID=8400 RepID=A0A2G9QAD4_AQUCT|nr:hypothetical protein AB205_0029570 [Aquarana catesbeiana]
MMTWQLEMEKLTVTMKVPKKAKRAKKLHQIRSDLPNLKKDLLQVTVMMKKNVKLYANKDKLLPRLFLSRERC